MDYKEAFRAGFQEWILPELKSIREDNAQIKTILELTNQRLDDVNTHLADQSRRIDETRSELSKRIDETNKRIDDTRAELSNQIDETNKRIDDTRVELSKEIDALRVESTNRFDNVHNKFDQLTMDFHNRFDALNQRIDDLQRAMVRREEHSDLTERIHRIELDISQLHGKVAA